MSIQKITLVNQEVPLVTSAISELEPGSGSESSPAGYLERIASSMPIPRSPSTNMLQRLNSENQQLAWRPSSYISIETDFLGKTCVPRCPCQCHIPVQGSTPQWLKGVIGTAFFRFVGTPLLNHRACDFNQCGKQFNGGGSVRFQYLFPTWLLPFGVALSASWCSLNGIGGTWSLKIPRAVYGQHKSNVFLWIIEQGTAKEFHEAMVSWNIRAIDLLLGHQPTSLLSVSLKLSACISIAYFS